MKGLVCGNPRTSERAGGGRDLPGGLDHHPEIIPANRGDFVGGGRLMPCYRKPNAVQRSGEKSKHSDQHFGLARNEAAVAE